MTDKQLEEYRPLLPAFDTPPGPSWLETAGDMGLGAACYAVAAVMAAAPCVLLAYATTGGRTVDVIIAAGVGAVIGTVWFYRASTRARG